LAKRREMLAAHLSKDLRKQYKRRSMAIRKGDEVKIIRGEHAGKVGQVTDVNLKNFMIFVSGITLKKTVGTEKQVPIRPNKVIITSLNLDDNARQRILLRKVKEVKIEKKPEPKPVEKIEEKTETKIEEKQEIKDKKEKVEIKEEKHENEKDVGAKVLASRKKVNKMGSRTKSRTAQKA
jgi:large subunit ribosomal protein L24